MKQTQVLAHATNANVWDSAVYMTYIHKGRGKTYICSLIQFIRSRLLVFICPCNRRRRRRVGRPGVAAHGCDNRDTGPTCRSVRRHRDVTKRWHPVWPGRDRDPDRTGPDHTGPCRAGPRGTVAGTRATWGRPERGTVIGACRDFVLDWSLVQSWTVSARECWYRGNVSCPAVRSH